MKSSTAPEGSGCIIGVGVWECRGVEVQRCGSVGVWERMGVGVYGIIGGVDNYVVCPLLRGVTNPE